MTHPMLFNSYLGYYLKISRKLKKILIQEVTFDLVFFYYINRRNPTDDFFWDIKVIVSFC